MYMLVFFPLKSAITSIFGSLSPDTLLMVYDVLMGFRDCPGWRLRTVGYFVGVPHKSFILLYCRTPCCAFAMLDIVLILAGKYSGFTSLL